MMRSHISSCVSTLCCLPQITSKVLVTNYKLQITNQSQISSEVLVFFFSFSDCVYLLWSSFFTERKGTLFFFFNFGDMRCETGCSDVCTDLLLCLFNNFWILTTCFLALSASLCSCIAPSRVCVFSCRETVCACTARYSQKTELSLDSNGFSALKHGKIYVYGCMYVSPARDTTFLLYINDCHPR